MRPASMVLPVFKVIIISTLLMAIVGTGVNVYLMFNYQQQIDAVAETMKSEIAKNNCILY